MEKSRAKCFFFVALFLIFGISYVTSAGNSQEGTSSSGKVLPIILMKESGTLEIPNDLSMRSWFFSLWKTMNFHANTALHEIFFCAADTNDRKRIQKARTKALNTQSLNNLLSENCLFEKSILSWKKNFPLEIHCQDEPEPFISHLFEPNKNKSEEDDDLNNLHFDWPSCGPGQSRKLYRYGYQLWLESGLLYSHTTLVKPLTKSMAHPYKNTVDYEIYRFCYDWTEQELLYTKHTILSPDLLSNENLKEEFIPYPIEISNYDNEELDFTKFKKIYDRVNAINALNSHIIDIDTEIPKQPNLMEYKIEKLIPDKDFAFVLWKKSTFHYVNQNLMHKALIKPWNEINQLIRDKAQFPPTEYDIYTGTFDISTKGKKGKMLETSKEIRIPEIWVKIVHWYFRNDELRVERNQGIAIIANNHMDSRLEKIISEYCDYKYMYQYYSSEDQNVKEREYSYIRSCLVTSKIEKLFGLNLGIENEIEISRPHFKTPINYEEEKLQENEILE